MTTDRARFVRNALASAAAIVLLAGSTGSTRAVDAGLPAPSPAAAPAAPTAPVVISHLTSAPQRADAVLPINVRITPSAGVGRAVLWFLGEHDTVFRPFPMRRLEGDVFTARLGVWKSRGSEVRFYIEAWDEATAQHAALGDRNTPLVVKLKEAPAVTGSGIGASALWIGILGAALLGACWCGILVRRRLPPPARIIEESPAPYRVMPIVVRAAGSMPAETVYLHFENETDSGQPAPARSAGGLRFPGRRGAGSRKSRLAYRRRPEDE